MTHDVGSLSRMWNFQGCVSTIPARDRKVLICVKYHRRCSPVSLFNNILGHVCADILLFILRRCHITSKVHTSFMQLREWSSLTLYLLFCCLVDLVVTALDLESACLSCLNCHGQVYLSALTFPLRVEFIPEILLGQRVKLRSAKKSR